MRVRAKDTGDKRRFFRLTDVMPITFRKCSEEEPNLRSRCLFGLSLPTIDRVSCKDSSLADLWKALLEINQKLNFIIEKTIIEREGIDERSARSVTLSESGLGVILDEPFGVGDLLEIRILLPSAPSVGILTYGKVRWVSKQHNNRYRIGISFILDDETVTASIRRYVLGRQRDRASQITE